MDHNDPLDRIRHFLSGIVQADILDAAVSSVRREFSGERPYIHSERPERARAIKSALASGIPTCKIAAMHGITRQAVAYHKKQL